MKLTIFDLDNTILKGDSDYSWIEFLINNNYVDISIPELKKLLLISTYNHSTSILIIIIIKYHKSIYIFIFYFYIDNLSLPLEI